MTRRGLGLTPLQGASDESRLDPFSAPLAAEITAQVDPSLTLNMVQEFGAGQWEDEGWLEKGFQERIRLLLHLQFEIIGQLGFGRLWRNVHPSSLGWHSSPPSWVSRDPKMVIINVQGPIFR